MMLKVLQSDKHEALSMHIEQEKLNTKLRGVVTQKAILDKIGKIAQTIMVGSSKATGIYLYISLPLPKSILRELMFVPHSHPGNKLMGNIVGLHLRLTARNI
jgi:hypothetical protein